MDYIRIEAEAILNKMGIKRLPIELKAVCAYLGIELKQSNLLHHDGMLLQSHKNNIIIVDKKQRTERKRFTIAHEIGHYVMGHRGISYLGGKDAIEEQEANVFASELLMPTKYMLHLWSLESLYMGLVAGVFDVSQTAALIGIEQLYKRHWEITSKNPYEIKSLRAEYDCSFEMQSTGFKWPGYI